MRIGFDTESRFWVLLILAASALILFAESIALVKSFAILYGVGVGASVQSVYSGSQIVQSIQRISISASSFPIAIDISYVLSIVAMLAVVTSVAMILRRGELKASGLRAYGLVNTLSILMYLVLFIVLLSEFYFYLNSPYTYVLYFGIALGIAAGAYLQYGITLQKSNAPMRSVVIDPAAPFSNIVALQEGIFSRLSGSVRIVDKHFNSTALMNLHRLVNGGLEDVRDITVITSADMIDSDLSKNISEFSEELNGRSVKFQLRLMASSDSVEQHERFMMDDNAAYKIPPFNIINRKSEHITRIRISDVKRRFDHLYANSMTLENYKSKKAREGAVNGSA